MTMHAGKTCCGGKPDCTKGPDDVTLAPLGRVKKTCVKHWKWQRLSAYAMIPLFAWFITGLLTQLLGQNEAALTIWMHSTVNAVMLGLLLVASFIHARLGIHEIVTDYIRCSKAKCMVVGLVDVISLLLGLASIAAICHLHTV